MDWIELVNLALGLVSAVGTGGIIILLHQWYVDTRKEWPYRVKRVAGLAGSKDGRSGMVSFWVENPTSRNAYFVVWGKLSDGTRMFPKSVTNSLSDNSSQITASVPPREEAIIDAEFEGVPVGSELERGVITEEFHQRTARSFKVSIYLADVRRLIGEPDIDSSDSGGPVAGRDYTKDIRYLE